MAAKMKEHEANIRKSIEKTKFVESHIDKKKDQLEESKNRVAARFEKHAESISEDHEAELERLDSHAYKIIEEIYPEQVQKRFSYESTVFWNALAEHSSKSAAARSTCLQEGNDEAASSVSSFLDEREEFYETLAELTSRGTEEGVHTLPYWQVELKDTETGKRQTDVLFPWDLYDADPPVDSEMVDALREAARENGDDDTARSLSKSERDEIASRLLEHCETPPSEVDRFREDDPKVSGSK